MRRPSLDPGTLRASALIGCWLVLLAAACARQHSTPFLNERAAAERHYASGHYSQAAAAWRNASQHAEHRDDRVEALYRAAAAHQRAGDFQAARAAYLEVVELAPSGPRAARAAFELAWLDIEGGNPTRGEQALRAVML